MSLKVDKRSVIEFDWGSTNLKTFGMDRKGHDSEKEKYYKTYKTETEINGWMNWSKIIETKVQHSSSVGPSLKYPSLKYFTINQQYFIRSLNLI